MDPWHLVDIRDSRPIMLPQILRFSVSHAKITKWMAVWKGAWSPWYHLWARLSPGPSCFHLPGLPLLSPPLKLPLGKEFTLFLILPLLLSVPGCLPALTSTFDSQMYKFLVLLSVSPLWPHQKLSCSPESLCPGLTLMVFSEE